MRLRKLRVVTIATTLILIGSTFQNCSSAKNFSSTGDQPLTDSTTPALSGGGEGYGGKPYHLISPNDACAGAVPTATIQVQSLTVSHLVAKDCQTLKDPVRVYPQFWSSDLAFLDYNGQTFRDETSSTPFTPAFTPESVIEVENFSRLPTSGGGVTAGILRITDNDYASTTVNLTAAGRHYFSVRAAGDTIDLVGAIVVVSVDGVEIGRAETGDDLFADFTFSAVLTAGNHTLRLEFINDTNEASGDRNLKLDRVTIGR